MEIQDLEKKLLIYINEDIQVKEKKLAKIETSIPLFEEKTLTEEKLISLQEQLEKTKQTYNEQLEKQAELVKTKVVFTTNISKESENILLITLPISHGFLINQVIHILCSVMSGEKPVKVKV